jgi:hypothetical protein
MEAADVLAKLYERENALQAFWGFYITVAVGVIAFFGAFRNRPPKSLAVLLSVAFICFALVNGLGIYGIAQQRAVLFRFLSLRTVTASLNARAESSAPLINELLATSKPPSPAGYAFFHGITDLFVLFAIWHLALLRWTEPRPGAHRRL